MCDLAQLGFVSPDPGVRKSPPTPDHIGFIESLAAVSLPGAYIRFLMFRNGGYPQANTFFVTSGGGEEEWCIEYFFHLYSESSATQDIDDVVWQYLNLVRLLGTNQTKCIPIACDAGGNLICLDLSAQRYGAVVLWIHDEPGEPLVEVSDTFEKFLDLLVAPSDAS